MKRSITSILACILGVTFLFIGCSFLQINPSTDATAYENLGRDVGSYLKATKDQEWLAESKKWVDDVLLLTDEELISQNVLQTAYELLLAKYPEKAGQFLLVKSTLTILGVKINLNPADLLPEDRPVYIACVRGLLKGYSAVLE